MSDTLYLQLSQGMDPESVVAHAAINPISASPISLRMAFLSKIP